MILPVREVARPRDPHTRNIPLYFGYAVFSNLIFQRGIFLLYLTTVGFSNSAIGVLQAALFASNLIFEVPTGVLGDRFGRRWSIAIGLLLLAAQSAGMIALRPTLPVFVMLFLLNGLGFAFISGSNVALLYDTLKAIGQEDDYLRTRARLETVAAIVLGSAIAVGGFLQRQFGWPVVYGASAASLLIAFGLVVLMHEPPCDDAGVPSEPSQERMTLRSFAASKLGPPLLVFSFAYAFFEALTTPYFIYGQKLFDFYGLSIARIGIVYSVVQFSAAMVYLIADRVGAAIRFPVLVTVYMTGSVVLAAFTAIESLPLALVIFFSLTVLPEVLFILVENHVQIRVPSQIRATMMSAHSFLQSVTVALAYLGWGFLLDRIPVHRALSYGALLPLVALVLFRVYFRRLPPAEAAFVTKGPDEDVPAEKSTVTMRSSD